MTASSKPQKNALSITLIESVVFLRLVDFSTRQGTSQENASSGILRGLLTLNILKPIRVSSIQIELIGQSVVIWTEGPSHRYQAEMPEKKRLFSATQTFFRAPRSQAARRALSVEPGLSYYADEDELIDYRLPSPPSPTLDRRSAYPYHSSDPPRGRERIRRLSADETIFLREPLQEVRSPSPTPFDTSPEGEASTLPPNPFTNGLHTPIVHSSSRPTHRQLTPAISPPRSSQDSPLENRSFLRPPPMSLPPPASSRAGSRSPPALPLSVSAPPSVSFGDGRENSPVRQRSQSRGRMGARFSLTSVPSSILEVMRSVSGTRERHQSNRGGNDHIHSPHHPLGNVDGVSGSDLNNSERSGDGWQLFKKGTYTYPISFSIPSYLPPTIHCEQGSVTWHLKAEVHRPGVFTQKLTASRDVIFVVSPSDDNTEDTEVVFIERFWKDQFQYMLSVAGRVFPIGGTIPITLRLSPMDKVKIYRILAQIEERVDYYFTFAPMVRRTEMGRPLTLLSIRSSEKHTPILPLPQTMTTSTESPLHVLMGSNDNPSEFTANLMGPGPWSFQMALLVPSACGKLHCSNKNVRAPIQISHSLKIVIRAEANNESQIDPQTERPRQVDIVMTVPVHILSSLSNEQHTVLPRYFESLNAPSTLPTPCTCCGNHVHPISYRHYSLVPQNPTTVGPLELLALPEQPLSDADALYERNVTFERLITGQQSENGVLPPAYSVTL